MPRLVKRACDSCIVRKVRCDGAQPCQTCETSTRTVRCTYVKPAQKRGPKIKHLKVRRNGTHDARNDTDGIEELSPDHATADHQSISQSEPGRWRTASWLIETLVSSQKLTWIIDQYREQSYSVWPILRADVLLQHLNPLRVDATTYCLVAALCAATMSQLNLSAVEHDDKGGVILIDSADLARETIRIREQHGYREHLDVRAVLVSFFLHVHHARTDKRSSALMFIQEALSMARLLGLDRDDQALQAPMGDVVDNGEILFPLLWVTERGYTMHLGLSPSYGSNFPLPTIESAKDDAHVQGLLELTKLFVTFARCDEVDASEESLIETENMLQELSMSTERTALSRLADHCITREWMRTMIWQRALSLGLLSSYSHSSLMNFKFPMQVSRDLLAALGRFSSDDLLPLGRDQLLKCYEVANTLADTLLCNSALATTSASHFGPHEFLHGLYQKLQPFLIQDHTLDSILRGKTAEALLSVPARLHTLAPINSTQEDRDTISSPPIY